MKVVRSVVVPGWTSSVGTLRAPRSQSMQATNELESHLASESVDDGGRARRTIQGRYQRGALAKAEVAEEALTSAAPHCTPVPVPHFGTRARNFADSATALTRTSSCTHVIQAEEKGSIKTTGAGRCLCHPNCAWDKILAAKLCVQHRPR